MTTSCAEDSLANMKRVTRFVEVPQSAWKWNNEQKQYEAVANLPELTASVYENGAPIAYLFIGAKGKDEVQEPLPYINTYKNNLGISPYVETIKCNYQLSNPSTVLFTIKTSDLQQHSEALGNYAFKIVMIL